MSPEQRLHDTHFGWHETYAIVSGGLADGLSHQAEKKAGHEEDNTMNCSGWASLLGHCGTGRADHPAQPSVHLLHPRHRDRNHLARRAGGGSEWG